MVYGGDAIRNIHALRLAVDSHLVNYNYHDQKKNTANSLHSLASIMIAKSVEAK